MDSPDPSSARAPAGPDADRRDELVRALAHQGYASMPDFLSPDLTAALLRELEALFEAGGSRAAGVGRGMEYRLVPEVRSDQILWLDPGHLSVTQSAYWQALEDLRQRLNRQHFLGLADYECHFARYLPGGYYRRHRDVFRGEGRRRISCVFYMNFGWRAEDGGQLRLYLPGKNAETAMDIQPIAGKLVIFDSLTMEHEVLPALKSRCSLAGWFRTA